MVNRDYQRRQNHGEVEGSLVHPNIQRPLTHTVTAGYLSECRPCLHCDAQGGYRFNNSVDAYTCYTCGAKYLPVFDGEKRRRGVYRMVV